MRGDAGPVLRAEIVAGEECVLAIEDAGGRCRARRCDDVGLELSSHLSALWIPELEEAVDAGVQRAVRLNA